MWHILKNSYFLCEQILLLSNREWAHTLLSYVLIDEKKLTNYFAQQALTKQANAKI